MNEDLRISPLETALFWYFLAINLVYTILLLLGSLSVYFRRKELSVENFTHILHSNSLPEITFVVPMYNEAKTLASCIESILHLTYRYKQVIAVNDGSEDKTVEVFKKHFDLVPIPRFYKEKIPTQPVRQVYRSRTYPEILFIDKGHGGKYDAVNAAINACMNPYFITIDSDTFVDNEGFEALIRPLLAYPETVAIGASVRIKNGCTLDFNRIRTEKMAFRWLPIFQGLEYLRSFLQRQGWNYVGGNFVIAGAFSIFPTDLIRSVGGLSSSVAEDMEIVVRIQKLMREKKKRHSIFYLPDPIAWTEGPDTIRSLGKQRTRWHLGLLETLWYHKKICCNPRYGAFAFLNYPFWLLGEAFEPVAEAIGYVLIVSGWVLGFLNKPFVLLLILITLGFTFVYSTLCLLIEELSFRKYPSFRTIAPMILLSLIENLGYRQLTIYWRLRSFLHFFRKFKKIHSESKRINQMRLKDK